MTNRPIPIVDDEPGNRATLRQLLAPHYALVFARSGLQALEVTGREHASLILLDIQMPDMDGHSVCRRLKEDRRPDSIPVIFVAGWRKLAMKRRALRWAQLTIS